MLTFLSHPPEAMLSYGRGSHPFRCNSSLLLTADSEQADKTILEKDPSLAVSHPW